MNRVHSTPNIGQPPTEYGNTRNTRANIIYSNKRSCQCFFNNLITLKIPFSNCKAPASLRGLYAYYILFFLCHLNLGIRIAGFLKLLFNVLLLCLVLNLYHKLLARVLETVLFELNVLAGEV